MKHKAWIVALLGALVLTGALAAQASAATGADTAVPSSTPVHSTLSAAQLAQILGTGRTGGIATTPEPIWESCGLSQCFHNCGNCHAQGIECIAECVDLPTCTCQCQC